jgi:hypothetical protein
LYIAIASTEWPLVTWLPKHWADKQAKEAGSEQPVETHQG